MDYHIFKSAINRFLARYVGYDRRPTFFDINQINPALNLITQNFPIIQTEFQQALQQMKSLPRYHDIDPGEKEISAVTEKNWNVFMLFLLGQKPEQSCLLCPETSRLLEQVPNLIQAFFSILEPGKSIPLHEGPYLGYLRYHLGIQVPVENPPQIIVNNQAYTWQEGQAVMFDDSWPHAVENNCEDTRTVLIIDVFRPLPFLPNLVNKFVTNVIARYTYGRNVMKRIRQQAVVEKAMLQ